MAFLTGSNVTVELQGIVTAGVWTDVTNKVRVGSGITINRGRQTQTSGADPASCSLVFDNRDGRFSPRNPTGPYYGLIGRNTPVRVSTKVGATRLTGTFATAPDSVATSVTGDIDVRIDMKMARWPLNTFLMGKLGAAGQRSWQIYVDLTGRINFGWSADGTTLLSAASTASLPQTTGRQAIRATLDVDNGAAGRTATFYTAPTAAGPWLQLGDPVVQAGTTSIFDSTAPTQIGSNSAPAEGWDIYSAEVRSGIGGSLVANPVPTGQTEGASSFADAQGNTWTLGAGASITNRRYRFYGEISAWPQTWDQSGRDVTAPVQAAGILRRLGQGSEPLKSSIQRFMLGSATAYAYWPMDDEVGSTSLASGLSAGPAMSFSVTPNLAADSTFLSSNSILTLNKSVLTGYVNTYAATGTIFAHFVFDIPSGGDAAGVLLRLFTTGTAARWDLTYNVGGSLTLQPYDTNGTLITTVGPVPYGVDGFPGNLQLQLVQSGSDINYSFGPQSYVAGAAFGGATVGTLAGRTVGAATAVQVNPTATLNTTAFGHLAVFAAVPDTPLLLKAVRGFLNEAAGRRIERLCGEEGVTFTAYGDLDQTVLMGAQRPLPLLDLLAECETADMGQLFESRENLGLAYRTRDSRQYQAATLALAYSQLQELVPIEDDQGTRNDVTVTRTNGSSARATVDTGSLSTQAPPNGVGRYQDAIEVNVATDAQLADQAQWRATEGTIDEPRYPSIVAHLAAPAFVASSALTTSALSVDHGDLLTITGTPVWLPPGTIAQHTIGQTETLNNLDYVIDYTCVPASPAAMTGTLDDGTTRLAMDGQTVGSAFSSTALGAVLIIVTPANRALVTTAAGDFPMDIVITGERITLSAVSGTSSPQTGTISARLVNGVVKAHGVSEAIEIADPDYLSL